MKILVTSGGTKVPIDDVRSITNTSSGNFGAKIVTALLLDGHNVTHFHANGSPTPFEFKVDLLNARGRDFVTELEELHQFARNNMSHFTEETFTTYDDYAHYLEVLCKLFKYDAVVLCAAVSDYKVENQTAGKISSNDGAVINLVPVDKLISKVRGWLPDTYLVGFKLTSGVTDRVLLQHAVKSLSNNDCDLVVANELSKIRDTQKQVLFVAKDSESTHRLRKSTKIGTSREIAKELADVIKRKSL